MEGKIFFIYTALNGQYYGVFYDHNTGIVEAPEELKSEAEHLWEAIYQVIDEKL